MASRSGRHTAGVAFGLTRRGFLQTTALGSIALGIPSFGALSEPANIRSNNKACILILNVGGVSHLDTFDMKPDAPREIRGPFRPIRTNNPDIQVSELFPLHAKIADKYSLVRGCYHDGSAIHDAGHQIVQTGRLFHRSFRFPHVGCAAEYLLGQKTALPAHVLLPAAIGQTGGNSSHGQDAGFLGSAFDPFMAIPDAVRGEAYDLSKEPLKTRERYGLSRFGQSCLLARRLVERGVRFITLNTFSTVFNEPTWDVHGFKPFSTMADLRDVVAPAYDRGYSALIEDLFQRGLLDNTLVAALSEFGRTPKLNAAGGRDHWTHCWTTSFAGGGIKGGRVVGKSDAKGAFPVERPASPGELLATIYQVMKIPSTTLLPGADYPCPLLEPGTEAIRELF